jgi:hypothetical protein
LDISYRLKRFVPSGDFVDKWKGRLPVGDTRPIEYDGTISSTLHRAEIQTTESTNDTDKFKGGIDSCFFIRVVSEIRGFALIPVWSSEVDRGSNDNFHIKNDSGVQAGCTMTC